MLPVDLYQEGERCFYFITDSSIIYYKSLSHLIPWLATERWKENTYWGTKKEFGSERHLI